jgi:hypothetical protein
MMRSPEGAWIRKFDGRIEEMVADWSRGVADLDGGEDEAVLVERGRDP